MLREVPECRMGSACQLELICFSCGPVKTGMMSQKSGVLHTGYDVNRLLVTAASATGLGFAQASHFFALMNLPPPMNETTWYHYKGQLNTGAKSASAQQEAAEQVQATYGEMNLGVPNEEGVLDISASIDGSWQKRGRQSHIGIVSVIDIVTGLITDYVVLSNFCQGCLRKPDEGDP